MYKTIKVTRDMELLCAAALFSLAEIMPDAVSKHLVLHHAQLMFEPEAEEYSVTVNEQTGHYRSHDILRDC